MVLTESHRSSQVRTYRRAESVVFLKTNEPFGGLSNMAGGFPLCVNGIRILTSEALYQACRFPHRPEVQWLILGQPSPMTAKMKSKPHRHDSRPDWDQVRVKIMRWCLRVKLAQNWEAFSSLLLETGDRPIVEQSRKDDFWGARPVDEQTLVGRNALGRLLMELREVVKAEGRNAVLRVEPVGIPDFLLGGRPIEATVAPSGEPAAPVAKPMKLRMPAETRKPAAKQVSLFEAGVLREAPPPEYGEESAEQVGVAGLKPYPAMKDSGVPWLGEVPAHWEVCRIRNLAELRVSNVDKHAREGELPVKLCNYMDVYKHDRILRDMPFMRATASPEEIDRFRLEPGDVLMTKDSEAWDDIGVPALVEQSDEDLVCGYHLALLRPFCGRILGEYLFRVLQSTAAAYQFHVEANGVTRYGLSHSAIKSIWLPLPPLPEQAVIARFLDYVDWQIRRYIRSKQKLIKLLEEQKQAIVHRAVTRGFAANACLAPSGVDWLGEIPVHWQKVQLGRCLRRIDQGWSPVAAEGEALPDQWTVLTLSSVKRGTFNSAAVKPVPASANIPAGIEVMDGDLLLTRSNTRERVGDVCIVKGSRRKTVMCDLIYRLTVEQSRLNPAFLMYQLLSGVGRNQIERDARGSSGTMPKISQRHVRSWLVIIPPLAEQGRIVKAIEEATTVIDDAVRRAQQEIALLREYRTRLIADVVTGKLDVREAAARLPAEAEMPEPLDEAEALDDSGDEAAEELDAALLEAEA